jgi:osmotically-inducible protein OsmY
MIDTPDAQVRIEVERRLTEDSRTRDAVLEVAYSAGQVTLSGDVRSAAAKTAAEEIAQAVPGVTMVTNELRVR